MYEVLLTIRRLWFAGLSPFFDRRLSAIPACNACVTTLCSTSPAFSRRQHRPTPKPVQNACQSDAPLALVATTLLLPATRTGVFPRFANIAGEDA
jgi:hypothetical protein